MANEVGAVIDAERSDKQNAANSVTLNRGTEKDGKGPDGGQGGPPSRSSVVIFATGCCTNL